MREGGTFTAPRRATAVLWVLPAILLAVSALLSLQLLRERSPAVTEGRSGGTGDSLFLEISRHPAFAFGFRNFLGDLAWLQAVQVSGERKMTPAHYDRLYLLLQAVGNLDPRFVLPYLLGGIILGDSPGHAREALEILGRGMEHHPDNWQFPFYIGYTRYFSLGDPLEGAKALEAAARIPESPPYLPLLAARMYSEGRDPGTALAFLAAMERVETDPSRLESLRGRILEVIVERDIQALERAAAAYRERTGRAPGSLSDLVRERVIPALPDEPHGGSYFLREDGTVRSDRVATRMKVFRKR